MRKTLFIAAALFVGALLPGCDVDIELPFWGSDDEVEVDDTRPRAHPIESRPVRDDSPRAK